MKLLLTSSGISNPSINDALVGLLGKPVAESSALFVPTAIYPFPDGPGKAFPAGGADQGRNGSGVARGIVESRPTMMAGRPRKPSRVGIIL